MKNIANDRKPFGTRWKITEGSLSESGYEPEDEANERSRNKEVSRAVTANPRHRNKISNSRRMLSTHGNERGLRQHIVNDKYIYKKKTNTVTVIPRLSSTPTPTPHISHVGQLKYVKIGPTEGKLIRSCARWGSNTGRSATCKTGWAPKAGELMLDVKVYEGSNHSKASEKMTRKTMSAARGAPFNNDKQNYNTFCRFSSQLRQKGVGRK